MNTSAELIFTGDELLRGDTINTNQSFVGSRLLDLGLFATRALCILDDRAAIADAIREAIGRRPELVLLSGGLGPTEDDLTREAVSDALGLPLVFRQELFDRIAARFERLNAPMAETNRKQAFIPEGATAMPFTGTAPGFWLVHDGVLVASLPGVPHELRTMWDETLGPLLRRRLEDRWGSVAGTVVRRIRTFGIGEGLIAQMLRELPWRGGDVDIGTNATIRGVNIMLRSRGTAPALDELERLQTEVLTRLADRVYAVGDRDMAEVVGRHLLDRGLTLVTAESCTAGLVAKRLTDVAGSSRYFLGGAVTYTNELKTALLGVPENLLAQHGAVSEPVAKAMAEGARARLGGDCAIAITGIAGPDGGTPEKPVGLVYIATSVGDETEVTEWRFWGSREDIRERTAQTALDLLRLRLLH